MDLEGVCSSLEHREDEFVDRLRAMVDVDCGTHSPAGVNRIADLCVERFVAGGWKVERRPHVPARGGPQLGDLVIGRMEGAGGPRILLIGHTDTVFPDGTVEERPFRIIGERALGPGVSDMKGGLLAGFFAVEALVEAGVASFGSIVYLCNPDEEIGSPFSRSSIVALARSSDVAFVLESARENGAIVSSRKGVTTARIDITGRAAHAGVEPERGRNALLDGARKLLALQALNDRWPGVTVNVGVMSGGIRSNVVPDRCSLDVDVRSTAEVSLAEAEAEVARIAEEPTVPDLEVSIDLRREFRPMERTEATGRLVKLAREVGRDLGFDVQEAATGGASDANTTAALGVPTLDGLGPIGGDDHGPAEWLDLRSVVPRTALLAGLIARSGRALGRRD